ncbi:MAG: type IV pili twitching motility protein PilT [Chlamydiae bacterium]|nr:MAG: type IV pili twitching motility protein PilT [Chlamydiota bacterium]
MTPQEILRIAIERGASDVHMAVGRPPMLRVLGMLVQVNDIVLTPDDTNSFVNTISSDKHLKELTESGGADFSYVLDEKFNFRVSIFKQRTFTGCVLRLIPNEKLDLNDIGIGQVEELLFKQRGLILVTGPTGSGKSTTLAAMIDLINKKRQCNIITVEDPIEYRHDHSKSIIIQREVGEDVPSFEEAIVKALRQDPDVILVGEMRNLETISAAIRAAETGHLVMSTLHTTGAARTVDRIVDVFPSNNRDEIRTQLAGNLLCVISQQLIRKKDGNGRVAAFEIMFNTPSIATHIRENKTYRITSDLQTGAKYGMFTMDSYLIKLYFDGIISYQDMIDKCYDKEMLEKLLKNYA